MADPDIDDADLAVDDLRRRARRRLVGAIVLALAAAVILPLLLEKEPRPLGDDVSVQIPPVDEGRFVNRLTAQGGDAKGGPKQDAKSATKAAAAKAEPAPPPVGASDAAPTAGAPPTHAAPTTAAPAPAPASDGASASPPRKSLSEAEQRVLAPATKAAPKPDAKPAPDTKAAPEAKASAEPRPAAAPQPAKSEPVPAPAPAPASAAAQAQAAVKGDGFVVQIAAFTDDKGANAQAAKLTRAGYSGTYVEPMQTSRGTLWRVRVGGYATRADAEEARRKLKADGYNGWVAPAK